LDLFYLFWAITTGITIGAFMFPLALIASVILFFIIFFMTRKAKSNDVYIVIVHYRGDKAGDAIRIAMARVDYRIKSKTARGELTEIAMEANVKDENLSFSDKLRNIDCVEEVTLVQYDGEYHG